MSLITTPVSHGELLDKITILEIKAAHIADAAKLANVRNELTLLQRTWDADPAAGQDLGDARARLKAVNQKLWDIEDQIRLKEKAKAFDDEFIALARAVYGGPRLVLLDEPTAWLDAEGEAAVGRMIGSLAREGRGVVFTTHRPPLLRLAQRVVTVPGPRALPAAAAPKALAAA